MGFRPLANFLACSIDSNFNNFFYEVEQRILLFFQYLILFSITDNDAFTRRSIFMNTS